MKQDYKKAATKDQPEKVKKATPPVVTRTTQAEAAAELDDIFRSVKQTKPTAHKPTPSSAVSQGKPKGAASTFTAATPAHTTTTTTTMTTMGEPLPKKTKRDGLYHAPEKNVAMSDAEFFGGSSGHAPGGGGGAKSTTSAVEAELLRREGVNRILSMKDLEKMLSKNPKAGTTPNCPFDCDCCF